MPTTEAFYKVSFPDRAKLLRSNLPAVLEPYIHRGETAHLSEDLLLASLGSN